MRKLFTAVRNAFTGVVAMVSPTAATAAEVAPTAIHATVDAERAVAYTMPAVEVDGRTAWVNRMQGQAERTINKDVASMHLNERVAEMRTAREAGEARMQADFDARNPRGGLFSRLFGQDRQSVRDARRHTEGVEKMRAMGNSWML